MAAAGGSPNQKLPGAGGQLGGMERTNVFY